MCVYFSFTTRTFRLREIDLLEVLKRMTEEPDAAEV